MSKFPFQYAFGWSTIVIIESNKLDHSAGIVTRSFSCLVFYSLVWDRVNYGKSQNSFISFKKLLHFSTYFFQTKIANAAFVRMGHVLLGFKTTFLYGFAHTFISISKRNAIFYHLVQSIHAEQVIVFRIFQNVGFYFDFL